MSSSSTLTPEQRKKIEENRRIALEKRAAKLNAINLPKPTVSNASNNTIQQINALSTSSTSNGSINNFFNSNYFKSNSKNFHNSNFSKSNFKSNTKNFYNSNYSKYNFKSNPAKNTSNSSAPPVKTWNVSTEILSANLHLISKDRFGVEVGFNQKVIDLFKTITGKIYDANKKLWHFPLSSYGEFKEKAASLSSICVFGSIPPTVVEMFQSNNPNSENNIADIDLSTIDPVLLNRLFPFQKEGIRFGISKGGKIIIADDMGLGKTLQALGIAHYYSSDWPLLIVCPSSMRFQWHEEICNNIPSLPSYRSLVIVSKKDDFENSSVIIISYDLMAKLKDKLKAYKFGVIILDESHSLKSYKSQRTQAALDIVSRARRIILLSGTPALSRPIELYTQIKTVSPYLFKDLQSYGIRYCDGKQDRYGWNFNGSSNLNELRLILEEKIMIRRLKSEVLNQLPSKMRHVVILNKEKINCKSKSMDAFAKKLDLGGLKGADQRSTLLAYFAETGRVKIKAICEHLEQILEQNKKCLIFAHHKEVMNAICETLEEKETYYIRIDGTVNSEERKLVCDQFQEDEKFRVAVLSIKAANTGVTLTAAQLVIFAELFWNPGELTQAEDRAHRIGQKDTVMIQYLLAKNTADDYLWPLVQSKLNVLSKAGLSTDSHLKVETLVSQEEKMKQPLLTDFFSNSDDDDFNNEELCNILDEIEHNIPEKRRKVE